MKKNYISPRIKCMTIIEDALMLPDSVSGGDVTPPTVNNVARSEDGFSMEDGDFQAQKNLPTHYNAWEDDL